MKITACLELVDEPEVRHSVGARYRLCAVAPGCPVERWGAFEQALTKRLREGIPVELPDPPQRPTDAEYAALGRACVRYRRTSELVGGDYPVTIIDRLAARERAAEAQEPAPAMPSAEAMADAIIFWNAEAHGKWTPAHNRLARVADDIRAARGAE